jgi:hypothetical protein
MHRCCVRLYSVGIGFMLVDQMLVCGSITTITNLCYTIFFPVLTCWEFRLQGSQPMIRGWFVAV